MQKNTSERTIERLLRQQAALAAFGMFAFRETNLHRILTEAARVCAESLGVPFCKVCRYRPEYGDLLIDAGVGWHAGVVGMVVSPADESSPQGRAYITRHPVLIKNLHQINDLSVPAFYPEHGIVSTIDVPIQGLDGPPYGVLEIDSPFEHAYDEHDINFLTGFTNVLAEAVATAGRIEALRKAVADKDALIGEKTTLAQELQHRVRNNLHIVHAMLTSELGNRDAAGRGEAIAAIARRVMTMARVYDHLLGIGMTRTIDFCAYLTSLCAALPETQGESNHSISINCATDDAALTLDLDTVTALGMVVAELVANSYKHAFPSRNGAIAVTLRHEPGSGHAVLGISDDGIGLPMLVESKRHGLGLARRLMEQVGGSITALAGRGTAWRIVFPVAR